MDGYILAFDQGTTSSRAIIFDALGKPVTVAQYPFPQIYPHPGWVEHDPMVILNTEIEAAGEAFEKSGLSPTDIAGIGVTNQRETTIIWDKKTGEIIRSTAQEGRGPGELLFHPSVSLVGNECYLYDRQLEVTQIYDLDKVLQGDNGYVGTLLELATPFTVGVYHGPGDRTLVFSNESFIQRDSSRAVTRIVYEKGTERYDYNEYPVPDRERTWSMYMTPYLTFSPDFTKMAITPAYGGIVERFDLSDGITLLGVDKFVEPDFDVKGGMAEYSVERPLPICFSGLASSNERIFAAMDEKGAWRIPSEDPRDHHMTVVAVFDWEGHPLMRIRTSSHIDYLAYDEAEGVLYAVLSDADNVLHIGKMKI